MHSLPTLNRCLNPQGAHTAYFLQRTPTPRRPTATYPPEALDPLGKAILSAIFHRKPITRGNSPFPPGPSEVPVLSAFSQTPHCKETRAPQLPQSFNLGTCSRQGHRKRCSPAFPRSGTSAREKPTLSPSPPLLASPLPRPPQPPILRGGLSSLTKLPLRGAGTTQKPPRGRQLPSGAPSPEQDGAALSYPPAPPWTRRRDEEEETAATPAPRSSRRRLRRGRTSAPGASGLRRLRRPGRTKPAPGTGARPPTPRPAEARPRPLASGSVAALAPPSARGARLGCPKW